MKRIYTHYEDAMFTATSLTITRLYFLKTFQSTFELNVFECHKVQQDKLTLTSLKHKTCGTVKTSSNKCLFFLFCFRFLPTQKAFMENGCSARFERFFQDVIFSRTLLWKCLWQTEVCVLCSFIWHKVSAGIFYGWYPFISKLKLSTLF